MDILLIRPTLTRKTKRKPRESYNSQAVCITDDKFVEKLRADKEKQKQKKEDTRQERKEGNYVQGNAQKNHPSKILTRRKTSLTVNVQSVESILATKALLGYNVITVKSGTTLGVLVLVIFQNYPTSMCVICSVSESFHNGDTCFIMKVIQLL